MFDPVTQSVLWVAIPIPLKKRLKRLAFETETPMNSLVTEALDAWLAAREVVAAAAEPARERA